LLGRDVQVLIKEVANNGDYVMGHSDQSHTVLVPKEQVTRMGIYDVRINSATPHTLYGSVKNVEQTSIALQMA
jgi:tRNA A37 methylthiotransferase MiaB